MSTSGADDVSRVRRPSLRERNRKLTREAILQAAQLLMMRDGAGSTSMAEVAQLAGVSDTTVFNYFKTKTDLLDAVVEELGTPTQFLTRMATRPSNEGPFAALRNLVREEAAENAAFDGGHTRRYLDVVRSDPALWGSYLRASHDAGEILTTAYADRAPEWSRLQARMAAHATMTVLTVLLSEADENWTVAYLCEQVEAVLGQLELAWPT